MTAPSLQVQSSSNEANEACRFEIEGSACRQSAAITQHDTCYQHSFYSRLGAAGTQKAQETTECAKSLVQ